MPLALGTRLGPYEILSLIGAGGMGEVYRARDTRLGRDVAIKVSNQSFSDRFEIEARAVAALNHPFICQIYDVGPNYLVMEYIDGAPLKGPLPLDQVLKYCVQICDALDAAHRKGITHRDLKPANILVTKSGIKLLDFGLAKRTGPLKETDATEAITADGAIVGTLNYMSPEQLQSKEADTRSDIFSFGIVLYEMLMGKKAYESASAASVIAAIIERPAPSVADVAPASLDRALKMCLAKDPEDRWQSARDLKHEFEWIAATAGESALVKETARPAWQFAAVAAVVASVLIALGAEWFFYRPSVSAPRLKLNLEPPPDGWRDLQFSPDGSMIAFSSPKGIFVRRVDSPEARLVYEHADLLAWSPDDRWLLIYLQNELRKISVDGGAAQTLVTDQQNTRGAAWTRDGTILFSALGPLFRVSENGGTPEPVTNETAWYPTMLPDGRHFLFLSGGAGVSEEAIYLGSLDSKQTRKLTEATSKAELSPSGHLIFQRGTELMAQPFDTSTLRINGAAVPIASDVGLFSVSRTSQFAVASNGLIAYQTGGVGRSALTWIDRSGKAQGVLDDKNFYQDVQISPDGKSVAATRLDPKTLRVGLWVTDLARGIATRMTSEDEDVEQPSWSPDGKRIAYDTWEGQIYVREIAGTGKTEKVTEGMMAAWMPDGAALLFSRELRFRAIVGLFVFPLGGDRKPVAYIQGHIYQATLSPDGKWVAYCSDESGTFQVYVQSFPSGHGKWQISRDSGAQPVWRRDGRELFYIQAVPGEKKIFAVPTKAGASFAPGVPKELFGVSTAGLPHIRRHYSVTPDGQRFLVVVREDDRAETILLQNWLNRTDR